MYEIEFYEDSKGRSEIGDWLLFLNEKARNNKESLRHLKQSVQGMELLSALEISVGEPVIKYIDSELWEIKTESGHIYYVCREKNRIVLLHRFMRKSQRTSPREVKKLKEIWEDYFSGNRSSTIKWVDLSKRLNSVTQSDWYEIHLEVKILSKIMKAERMRVMTSNELRTISGENHLEQNKSMIDWHMPTITQMLKSLSLTLDVVPAID